MVTTTTTKFRLKEKDEKERQKNVKGVVFGCGNMRGLRLLSFILSIFCIFSEFFVISTLYIFLFKFLHLFL